MDIKNVTETIAMIEEQNFDIRTITMGISLLDCIDPDIDKTAEKIYAKITDKARDLVKVGNEISAELGIPIVNKRVCVTPIAIIVKNSSKTVWLMSSMFSPSCASLAETPATMPTLSLPITVTIAFISTPF